jgi:long-chain acyl-CoA synthetase
MKADYEFYRRDVFRGDVRLSLIDLCPAEYQRTMVFIHGFGGNATFWEHQLAFFCDQWRVVSLDLRGHGASDAPNSEYTIDEMVGDVIFVLKELGIERCTLVAHSFGGALASEIVARYPGLVDRLVLVGTVADFRLNALLRFALTLPPALAEPIRARFPRQLSAPAHVLKKMYHHSMEKWQGKRILSKVQTPSLVIYGHRDMVFPQHSYEAVARLMPNASSVIIPVSAHMVMLERPDAVNRAIARFLETSVSWRETKQKREEEKPWFRHYEKGVSRSVSLPHRPLHSFLEHSSHRFPNNVALIFYGRKTSYAQLEEKATRIANALLEIGLEKGTRVFLLLPTCPQFVMCYYGILKAGCVAVCSNPIFSSEEVVRQVHDSGARVMITLARFESLASEVASKTRLQAVILTRMRDYLPLRMRLVHREATPIKNATMLEHLLSQASPHNPRIEVNPGDLALIQYTGGTTDVPKGSMLSHRNLIANTIQIRHWITDGRDGKETFLSVLPFSHVYGMTSCMNLAVTMAGTMVLLPTFNTQEVLSSIKKYHPTLFPGIPTMYIAINNFLHVRRFGISSIRACVSGAAPLPVEVQESFEKLTKGKIVEGYGLTEASPVTHVNPLYGMRKAGSIGVPLPGTDARIVDMATGESLPFGKEGELCVRGPQVMAGYWNAPDETARVLADGWLHTGDIATMDEDGYFYIIDRKKDMILAGDYNVFPRDVEEILYEHPKILEAAVAGIPPEQKKQMIKAFVVLKKGEKATKEEIIRFCKDRLSEYKVPQQIEFKDALPKTFVGKVLRRLLTEEK